MMKKMSISQRLDGFKGGIQTGTCAAGAESIRLDTNMRLAANMALERVQKTKPEVTMNFKFTLFEDAAGCAPDGGLWSYRGVPIAAFEAKHQGHGGNAIERWCKNYMAVKFLNARASYVTFTTGAGTRPRSSINRFFNLMFGIASQPPMYNVVNPGGISVFCEENGFEMDDIVDKMVDCVEQSISVVNE